ncbi:MAG TPA: hypothetical protein VMW02_00320, partial [Thermoplasmata archaeon]|nr:hypothetical protein [Thermoplasmata archaeon]
LVYGFQYLFDETYWSGDVDPNYLMYIVTSYAMDGWNEFGTTDPVYDNLYNLQAKEFNVTKRQQYLDECQKWQYLAGGAMIYTVYPKTCYAYNDAENGSGSWGHWGNWTEHPGLAVDHFWGETPLFYHVKWVGKPDIGGDLTMPIVAGAGIAAIVAAAAAMMIMRKRKTQSLLDEEEPEEEEEGGNP